MSSVNDSDVQIYLNELKEFVFLFGQTTNTGTSNLVELLNFILDDIDNIKYETQDKLNILSKRYALTASLIATYNNLYQNSLIEERYSFYKGNTIVITAQSEFMYSIVRQLDLTMKDKIGDLSNIRYENNFLLTKINILNDTLTRASTLKDDIDTLITKCNNT